MLIVSFILVIVLSGLLLWMAVKEKKHRKEIKLADQLYNAIWSNVHEFIFLIDRSSRVLRTNYYAVCNTSPAKEDMNFGEILQCRCAREKKNCSKCEQCKHCLVHSKIEAAFANHSSFSNLEISMNLQLIGRPAGMYSMMVSGRYLNVDGEDRMVLTVHDISEERALKSSLEYSKEKFLCFFDNVTVGCAICDTEGRLVEVNDAYVEYMGIESKEVAVDQLNIYTNPCIDPDFKKMMRQGIPVSGEVKYDYELINRAYVKSHHQGVHYFRFIVDYLRDAQGAVENILLIWVENTLIHQTIRQNKNFSEMILVASSLSNIGFSSINLLTNERLVTPEYLKNVGMPEDMDQGAALSCMGQLFPDDYRVLEEYVKNAHVRKMEPLEKNVRVMVDGKYRWIKQYLMQQTFEPENSNIVLLGVNVDIDRQKKVEEELRKAKEKAESSDRLKSAFLANMSHEIRTPLNAIVGFSDLLVNSTDKEDAESFKEIIDQNSKQLLQLIGYILDLSKIESGTVELVWTHVNVNAVMNEQGKIAQLRCKDNPNVKIKCAMGAESCIIRTDRQRFIQLVTNLTNNALKFTSKGSITLGYEVREDQIYFYVKDTGCGIPDELQSQIFQRFVQLDSFKQGTGLGLPICSSIVKMMGGEIGVKSRPGKGSTFWFTLPVQPVSEY